MYIAFSDRTNDTLIDFATILLVGIAGWGNTIHLIIASLVGVTIIVKNVYDVILKRQEKHKAELEIEKLRLENEKNSLLLTKE